MLANHGNGERVAVQRVGYVRVALREQRLTDGTAVLLTGASVCVYTGSLWSLQTPVKTRQLRKEAGLPERDEEDESESVNAESLSSEDAWMFPVIGSAVLLGLYVLFKMFDKELINMLLGAYFAVAGTYAVAMVREPAYCFLSHTAGRDECRTRDARR